MKVILKNKFQHFDSPTQNWDFKMIQPNINNNIIKVHQNRITLTLGV